MKNKPTKVYLPLGYAMQPGDIFQFQYNVDCRDGSRLRQDSLLIVLNKTYETPYNEIGPYGYNLICKADNGITTWATAESCWERGLLKYLGSYI